MDPIIGKIVSASNVEELSTALRACVNDTSIESRVAILASSAISDARSIVIQKCSEHTSNNTVMRALSRFLDWSVQIPTLDDFFFRIQFAKTIGEFSDAIATLPLDESSSTVSGATTPTPPTTPPPAKAEERHLRCKKVYTLVMSDTLRKFILEAEKEDEEEEEAAGEGATATATADPAKSKKSKNYDVIQRLLVTVGRFLKWWKDTKEPIYDPAVQLDLIVNFLLPRCTEQASLSAMAEPLSLALGEEFPPGTDPDDSKPNIYDTYRVPTRSPLRSLLTVAHIDIILDALARATCVTALRFFGETISVSINGDIPIRNLFSSGKSLNAVLDGVERARSLAPPIVSARVLITLTHMTVTRAPANNQFLNTPRAQDVILSTYERFTTGAPESVVCGILNTLITNLGYQDPVSQRYWATARLADCLINQIQGDVNITGVVGVITPMLEGCGASGAVEFRNQFATDRAMKILAARPTITSATICLIAANSKRVLEVFEAHHPEVVRLRPLLYAAKNIDEVIQHLNSGLLLTHYTLAAIIIEKAELFCTDNESISKFVDWLRNFAFYADVSKTPMFEDLQCLLAFSLLPRSSGDTSVKVVRLFSHYGVGAAPVDAHLARMTNPAIMNALMSYVYENCDDAIVNSEGKSLIACLAEFMQLRCATGTTAICKSEFFSEDPQHAARMMLQLRRKTVKNRTEVLKCMQCAADAVPEIENLLFRE